MQNNINQSIRDFILFLSDKTLSLSQKIESLFQSDFSLKSIWTYLNTLTFEYKPKIKGKDLLIFTQQFSILFNAGLPIIQLFWVLQKQINNKSISDLFQQIRIDIEEGKTLSESMKKYPDVFDEMYINLIIVGENGGILGGVLERLYLHIKKNMELKNKIRQALIYPSIIILVAIIVIAIIMIWIIPVFTQIFQEMGVPLPIMTQMVVNISSFLGGFGGLLILCLSIGLIVAVKITRASESGRLQIDSLLLKLPFIGQLLKEISIARFTRTLGILLQSGVPILTGFDTSAKSTGNKFIENIILNIKQELTEGKIFSELLSKHSAIFQHLVSQMVNVGETTGTLDKMLIRIADFYEDRLNNTVARMTTMLEPALMVVLGGVVGFLVISLYLPIFKLGGAIGTR